MPVAALVWLVTPDNYDVVAYLRVGDDPVKSTRSDFRNPAEYEAYRKTQAARIKSPLVLQKAILKLSEDPSVSMLRAEREPQRFLEDEISVSAPLEQELLAIRMRGRDPQQLVKIVNVVRDSYVENVLNSENQLNYERYNLLKTDLNAIEEDLKLKTERFVELQKKMNAADLPAVKYRYESLMQQTAQLRDASRKVKDDLGKVEMRLEFLKITETKGANVPEYLIDLNLSRDDQISHVGQTDHPIGNDERPGNIFRSKDKGRSHVNVFERPDCEAEKSQGTTFRRVEAGHYQAPRVGNAQRKQRQWHGSQRSRPIGK